METIDTDYRQRTWNIEAKVFKLRKAARCSFKHNYIVFSFHVRFKQLCERAFLILRRKGPLLINLFVMMLSAGLPELRSLDDIGYLRRTLLLSSSEEDAIKDFRKKFDHAINKSLSTSMNWFAHNLNQK